MRRGVINGNGYECDCCHTLLGPFEVIKISARVNADHTGAFKVIDTIGVCERCYEKKFGILKGRGPLRCRKKNLQK